MALSDLWTTGDSNGGGYFGGQSFMDVANGLTGLFGGIQGYNTASGINNNVQNILGAGAGNMGMLQGQVGQNQQVARQAYDQARGQVDAQNSGLNNDIGTMTANLQGLSDPNSPYMQMARQAIERKDAAAGRRSQWGEREVQLAAQLADYVGKYSPGMQSAITNARNQINQNNMGLASIYGTMNNPSTSGQNSLQSQLQQQLAAQQQARAAQNSQTNNLTGLLGQGIKGLGGLAGLFGGGSDGGGILGSLFQNGAQSGFGDGSLWGNSFSPLGDYGVDTSGLGGYGYGNLPAGDYFGGGGIGGVPTLGWDGGFGGGSSLSDDSLWD